MLDDYRLYTFLTYKFKHDYYNNTPDEIIRIYGPYVLTDYEAGGRAFGVYKGATQENIIKGRKKTTL